jgi:hypothetical protein
VLVLVMTVTEFGLLQGLCFNILLRAAALETDFHSNACTTRATV